MSLPINYQVILIYEQGEREWAFKDPVARKSFEEVVRLCDE
jgi:hypothetical protein